MSVWSIGRKLTAAFAAIIGISAFIGLFSACIMLRDARTAERITRAYVPEIALTSAFEREILNARIQFIYHVTIQKPGTLAAGWKRFRAARGLMPALEKQVQESPELAELRAPTKQLTSDLDAYQVSLAKILDRVATSQNHDDTYKTLVAEWARIGGRLVNNAANLNRQCSTLAGESSWDSAEELNRSFRLVSIGTVLAVAIGYLLGWLLARNISSQLKRSVGDLNKAAEKVATASGEVASASQSVAGSAAQQAHAIEDTSASCGRIASLVQSTTNKTSAMALTVTESQRASESGVQVLLEMLASMHALAASNERVSSVIKSIDDIAFKTNILALNAAVEAARAGEAGLGFAVVADEVRNLAQSSADAVKSTTELLTHSITTTSAANAHVDRASATMRSVASGTERAAVVANEVNGDCAEQTLGVRQIATSIEQLEQATQRIANDAKESASAAVELSSQAGIVKKITGELSLFVYGATGR